MAASRPYARRAHQSHSRLHPRVYLRQSRHLAAVLVDFAPENEVAALNSVFATSETLELADASRAHPAARCATNTTTVACLTGISIVLSDMFVIVTCSSSCRGACRAVIIAALRAVAPAVVRRTGSRSGRRHDAVPGRRSWHLRHQHQCDTPAFPERSRFDMQQIIASRLAFEYPFVANK